MVRLFALLVAGTITAFGSSAAAQTVCGDREVILTQLSDRYSEAPIALGLTNSGSVLEVLAAPSGSWTIIITTPKGRSCLLAAGEHWEALPTQLAGQGV